MALVGSPHGGRFPADEAVTQLRRRLAEESGDCDSAKLALHRLKTCVDFYRQRLQALLVRPIGLNGSSAGNDDSTVQRARDLVRDMEAEVHSMTGEGSPGAPGRSAQTALASFQGPGSPTKAKSYDVLRQSLEEAQRRCESLNNDMLHQTEANEEMIESLDTVKDANKRLLEQIRQQSSEIANLTQQRVADEEHMDQMTRRHESEREAIRHKTESEIIAVRETSTEKHNQVYLRLTDRLRHVRARSEMLMQDVGRLARELQERKGDANALSTGIQGNLQAAERDLTTQLEGPRKRHIQMKKDTMDSLNDLNVRLQAERDARHADGLTWGLKHGALGTDKEDVHARTTREISSKGSHLQALERNLHASRQSWKEDRAALEREHDEHLETKNKRKMALDQLQRDIVASETSLSGASSEIASLENVMIELKRQVRESDDALAAAISGNEHLREQMEEQRQRHQDKNENDLNEHRSYYEQKLADLQVAHEAEKAMAVKQLEGMHAYLDSQHEEHQKIQTHAAGVHDESTGLARDLNMWKSHVDSAKATRDVQEKDHYEGKQLFTAQRLKLMAGIDQMTAQGNAHEEDVKQYTHDLQDIRRSATARETERATRHAAATNALKDIQDKVQEVKGRIKDLSDQTSRVGSEAASARERALDVHMSTERSLDKQAKVIEEERRRMLEHLESERRTGEQLRGELNRERELTSNQLRKMHEESRNKLAGVEKERARIQEVSRAEIHQAQNLIAEQQKQIKALEHDLLRIQALQVESESNAHWVRQEHGHHERETGNAIRMLDDDTRAVSDKLELARQEESALNQQLESQRLRNEQERQHLRRTLDDLSGSSPGGARQAPFTAR